MNRVGELSGNKRGFAVIEILTVLAVVFILGISTIYVIHRVHQTKPNSTNSTDGSSSTGGTNANTGLYTPLAPSNVPSKAPECATPITFSSNGTSSPIQCSNGFLNVTEWTALAALEPQVMTLGYGASAAQIQSALCADVHANITNAIEMTNYQISSLYYGWTFGSGPATDITNGTCVNVDD